MTTSRWIALLLAVLGLIGLVTGAVVPWLRSPSGIDTGGGQASVPLLVAAVAAAVLTLAAHWRPRWVWIPLVATLVLVVLASLSPEPGWICWDGVDEDGNMVGGCENDEWTLAPVAFGVGAALTMLAAGVRCVGAWSSAPRS